MSEVETTLIANSTSCPSCNSFGASTETPSCEWVIRTVYSISLANLADEPSGRYSNTTSALFSASKSAFLYTTSQDDASPEATSLGPARLNPTRRVEWILPPKIKKKMTAPAKTTTAAIIASNNQKRVWGDIFPLLFGRIVTGSFSPSQKGSTSTSCWENPDFG